MNSRGENLQHFSVAILASGSCLQNLGGRDAVRYQVAITEQQGSGTRGRPELVWSVLASSNTRQTSSLQALGVT